MATFSKLKEVFFMTCKFCGSTIDDNLVECPYCGHKTGKAAPADPVAEMTEKFSAEELKDSKQETSAARKNPLSSLGTAFGNLSKSTEKKNTKTNSPSTKSNAAGKPSNARVSGSGLVNSLSHINNGIIAIGLVACLLLCLISIFSVAGMKRDLETMNQDMLSLFYQIQNSTDKLQSQVDALERSIGNVSTTITDQVTSRNITITKEPTSVSTYLGRGASNDNAQNVPIFTIYAQGIELKFTWQRYDEVSGDWIDLTLDNDSNNLTYGLHVYTDSSKGYSELSAHGVTQAAYGTYRCQIADNYGIKNSASVTLTERSRDEVAS